MFRVLIALALVCGVFAETFQVTPFGRIVNGEKASIEEIPWQVSIQTGSGSHFCGGSLIGPHMVLTAAHCMQTYPASKLQVRVGSNQYDSGGKLVGVKSFVVHPNYSSKTQTNDVAIIKLKSAVSESSTTQYIPLASKVPKEGTKAVVSGFGVKCYLWCTSISKCLQKVIVSIVSRTSCQNDYNYKASQVQKTMLCAYELEKDSCQGDSGGPLVANGQLVGVVSWGKGCAKENYPGVYANVAELKDWIESAALDI